MSGAIPPLPQYILMAWCSVKNTGSYWYRRQNNWEDKYSNKSVTSSLTLSSKVHLHKKVNRREGSFGLLKSAVGPIKKERPLNSVLLKKLTIDQLVKKLPAFYRSQRFNSVFTRTCCWILFQGSLIQSTPSRHISLRSVLILILPPTPGRPKWPLHFGFSDKKVCISHLPHACYITIFQYCRRNWSNISATEM